VRARTKAGRRHRIAAPFRNGIGILITFTRALYPLTGNVVLPLIDDHDRPRADNLARANVVAAYHCEPHLAGFAVVWRGRDGMLLRRMP
jgi:hypothetical protein